MSSTQKESKRSTKEKAAAARAAAEAEQKKRDRRVRLIGGTAILVVMALILGGAWYGSKQNASTSSTGVVADAKVPTGVNAADGDNPGACPTRRSRTSRRSRSWEDFQCPSCAQFEKSFGAAITKWPTTARSTSSGVPRPSSTTVRRDEPEPELLAQGRHRLGLRHRCRQDEGVPLHRLRQPAGDRG